MSESIDTRTPSRKLATRLAQGLGCVLLGVGLYVGMSLLINILLFPFFNARVESGADVATEALNLYYAAQLDKVDEKTDLSKSQHALDLLMAYHIAGVNGMATRRLIEVHGRHGDAQARDHVFLDGLQRLDNYEAYRLMSGAKYLFMESVRLNPASVEVYEMTLLGRGAMNSSISDSSQQQIQKCFSRLAGRYHGVYGPVLYMLDKTIGHHSCVFDFSADGFNSPQERGTI
jgi:hypothetical protein